MKTISSFPYVRPDRHKVSTIFAHKTHDITQSISTFAGTIWFYSHDTLNHVERDCFGSNNNYQNELFYVHQSAATDMIQYSYHRYHIIWRYIYIYIHMFFLVHFDWHSQNLLDQGREGSQPPPIQPRWDVRSLERGHGDLSRLVQIFGQNSSETSGFTVWQCRRQYQCEPTDCVVTGTLPRLFRLRCTPQTIHEYSIVFLILILCGVDHILHFFRHHYALHPVYVWHRLSFALLQLMKFEIKHPRTRRFCRRIWIRWIPLHTAFQVWFLAMPRYRKRSRCGKPSLRHRHGYPRSGLARFSTMWILPSQRQSVHANKRLQT